MIERIDSYDKAVSYILEIPRFLAKNETVATKEFLELLGEGEADLVIHVAGTNGKGSTCAFLNSVFMKMGKKTGMFTSPHLVDIRERIQINGEMISREDFLNCTNAVIDKINEIREKKEGYHPSFFEFVFFIAVRYFAQNNLDVVIWETGLGGRLDATNSLSRKKLSIITEIGMDHMEYLGDTFEMIAGEKAGIIAEGVPVLYWDGREECTEVFEKKAREQKSEAYSVSDKNVEVLCTNEKSIDFYYKSRYDNNALFTVHSYALYQVKNAAMAIKALEILGYDICSEDIITGISDMNWPGRMEAVEDRIFVDGGHNVDGIEAFINSVLMDGCIGRRHLIYSAVSDKQVEVISKMLLECKAFDRISLCEINSGRAKKLEELKSLFDRFTEGTEVNTYSDIASAYEAEKGLLELNDRLYICGSLYLVGAVKEYIEAKNND